MTTLYQTDREKIIRLAQSDDATIFTWQSAAQTDITVASFDTAGYKEFTVLVCCGSIATSGAPRIKSVSDSSDNSTFAALAGGAGVALTATDDYKNFAYNLRKGLASKRYYQVVVERPGGNCTVDAILVILKKSGGGAVTQDTTMGYRETALSPVDA